MLIVRFGLMILSLVGLVLNSLTLYITGICLRFNGIDLILMSLIAIFDIIVSITHIARMIALEANFIIILKDTNIWCIFDSTLVFTVSQTTIDTTVILGVLRYLAICHNKKYRLTVWIQLIIVCFLVSLMLSSGNIFYSNIYKWSDSGLFCLPQSKQNDSSYIYSASWSILTGFRILLSLSVISFCYYKISQAYHNILDETINSIGLKDQSTSSELNSIDPSDLFTKIKNQQKIVSIQLLGIALFYIICITPIGYIFVLKLTTDIAPPSNILTFAEFLYWSTIIINPLFVLISHEPSRRELMKLIHLA